jgi:hypothetical protein
MSGIITLPKSSYALHQEEQNRPVMPRNIALTSTRPALMSCRFYLCAELLVPLHHAGLSDEPPTLHLEADEKGKRHRTGGCSLDMGTTVVSTDINLVRMDSAGVRGNVANPQGRLKLGHTELGLDVRTHEADLRPVLAADGRRALRNGLQ